jgi:RHS repeat-associated protein
VTLYYIRDAQGNALAVYEQRGCSLVWKEQDWYGSSRLGMAKPEREVTGYFWASAAYTLVAGAKSYELSNHLGNVMAVISDRGELQSAQDYYPFGMAMPGRSTPEKHRYGFNGKETDPETGLNDFGARLYDNRLGRWLAIDPLAKKYPGFSPYLSNGDNPLIYFDEDGRDIVFFNMDGVETHRIKSNTVFKTYVDVGEPLRGAQYTFKPETFGYREAPMPNIIIQKPAEGKYEAVATTSSKYQKHDYQIAASVFIFNLLKEKGQLQLVTDGTPSVPIPQTAIAEIHDLNPTDVKALMIQETSGGTDPSTNGTKDVLQVNNGVSNFGDYDPHLKSYGIERTRIPNAQLSIHAGIKEIATKGFHGQTSNFKFLGWLTAMKNFNGGGAASKGLEYESNIQNMTNLAQTPKAANYVDPPKKSAQSGTKSAQNSTHSKPSTKKK